jgi:pyruvate kinase
MSLNRFRKTKVIATAGPAIESPEKLAEIIDAGVDVIRLNMSHMNHEQADEMIARIRRVSDEVAILMDLQGPKMRITDVAEPFSVEVGEEVLLKAGGEDSSRTAIYVPIEELVSILAPEHIIFIDDGRIRLRVTGRLSDTEVRTEVVAGGTIRGKKGLAVPAAHFAPANYLDEHNRQDIRFAVKRQVDFLAASYVSRAADVKAVQEVIADDCDIAIIAKIESQVGVDNIDEIIAVSDGIMVARGDLGVELPPEEVPLIQKALIKKCNEAAKPVVVATQMLDSMVHSPVASRAETSDVANAILDGTDAVMLSAETSVGKHPVQAVKTLRRISKHVEEHVSLFRVELFQRPSTSKDEFVCKAAARVAAELDVKAIVAFTTSGFTARNSSAYRPRVPIIATSPSERVARKLALQYGVYCIQAEHIGRYDVMLYSNLKKLLELDLLTPDDLIAVIGGVPVGISGSTNMMQVSTVRDLMRSHD